MATSPPRVPPKFVPTLTEVVQAPVAGVPRPAAAPVMPPASPGAATRPIAPVRAAPASVVERPPVMPAAVPSPAAASPQQPAKRMPDGIEEYMIHRVMQRVDVVLDQRLREAIATVVQEQTRSVLPRLREEIESVVRHAVYEAVADELASGQK